MHVQIFLPRPLSTKLRDLALRDLRPVELEAEFLLIHAIHQEHDKADRDARSLLQEPDHAPAS